MTQRHDTDGYKVYWTPSNTLKLLSPDNTEQVEISEETLLRAFVDNPAGTRFFLNKVAQHLRKGMPNFGVGTIAGLRNIPAMQQQMQPLPPTLSDDILGPQLRALEAAVVASQSSEIQGFYLPVG